MAGGYGQGKFLEGMIPNDAGSERPVCVISVYLDVGIPMNDFYSFCF